MAIKGGHSFPSSFGFSGSCGKQSVRGYSRGGPVKPRVRVPPAKDVPKGALDNQGPLMPGYKHGGKPKRGGKC